jgi:polyisoprenoid-binding protein YceI
MRTFALATLALALPAAAMAAPVTYTFDSNHTSVMWKASHMGYSTVSGKFVGVSGSLVYDEKAPAASKLDAVIDTKAIATGLPKFEEHLHSKDFFDVEKHPTARFVSTKVEPTSANNARVTGDLTMLGITKPVVLDVTLNKKAYNEMAKKEVIGFSAKGVVKRSDFGIKYALPAVSDDIPLEIEAELSPK